MVTCSGSSRFTQKRICVLGESKTRPINTKAHISGELMLLRKWKENEIWRTRTRHNDDDTDEMNFTYLYVHYVA